MQTENNNNEPNYFDLPDDQIMGMSAPAAVTPPAKTPEELEAERVAAEQAAAEQAAAEKAEADRLAAEETARQAAEAEAAAAAQAAGTADAGEGAGKTNSNPLAADDKDAGETPAAQVPDPAAKTKTPEELAAEAAAADKTGTEGKDGQPPAKTEPTAEDHKAFYDRLLAQPIAANGKKIQLRSPEEVEQLVKMGLNYTKKMQAWQPRMRVVTMLENNGLLDEAQLSYLIDLHQKKPEAIQKLLADSQFDPHTVDADKAASYKPGNHQVSDAEMNFNAALDDLESTDTGAELITEVAKQWDEQSRRAVYQDPSILRVINEQKSLGLYAVIKAEMDHLKSLGQLQGIPFLQAYRAVGDMLNDQGRLRPAGTAPKQPEVPVETRVATPPPQVTNNDKAKAASPTKATPTTVKTEQNFLDLPDDQFLKQMQGRL